jgi:S-adenosylmethionine/arginine decarboxylase-like enzyme
MYMSHWGYHLIVNARKCIPQTIRSSSYISEFTKRLVQDIDMVAYKEPQVVMFGTGNKKGYTLVQLIETSNITAHFVEESNDMYLDVFSCKPFDAETVKVCIGQTFGPEELDCKMIARDAKTRMA